MAACEVLPYGTLSGWGRDVMLRHRTELARGLHSGFVLDWLPIWWRVVHAGVFREHDIILTRGVSLVDRTDRNNAHSRRPFNFFVLRWCLRIATLSNNNREPMLVVFLLGGDGRLTSGLKKVLNHCAQIVKGSRRYPRPHMTPLLRELKGTNPALKKPSNIPEIYAKMFGRIHWSRL